MAGDWIKMRAALHTHPKVVRISSALHADRLRVIGGLHAVWCIFDAHAIDGTLDGYTAEALDDMIGFQGFAAAMAGVGWLVVGDECLEAPRFDDHNGQSAKRRAMETERKRNERKVSACDADKKRTREEKRREEKEQEAYASADSAADAPQSAACPAEQIVSMYHELMPNNPRCKVVSDARKRAIRQRWREAAKLTCKPFGYSSRAEGLAAWREFFAICAASPFLTGQAPPQQGRPPFVADIDFLMSPSGFAKTLENKYHREIAA